MLGISEKTLYKIPPLDCNRENNLLLKLINTCRELQEPCTTLGEFLKSRFTGLCWVSITGPRVVHCNFLGVMFHDTDTKLNVSVSIITHIMPIHKPEPPK